MPTFVERYVVLVAQRTPERVRPLDEVREQVTSTVLAQERTALRDAWLAELRERIDVEDSLLEGADEPFVFDDALPIDPTDVATDDPAEGDAASDEPAAEDGEAADVEGEVESEDGEAETD